VPVLKGGEVSDRKIHTGTMYERWLFDESEPALRCQWPTSDCAARLSVALAEGEAADLRMVRAVLDAYHHLLVHPMGAQRAVARLRALRRAERRDASDAGATQ